MHCFPVHDELWEAGKAAASGMGEALSLALRDFLRLYTDPLWREARLAAVAQGTTVTAVLREALARYVRRHEKTKETDRG